MVTSPRRAIGIVVVVIAPMVGVAFAQMPNGIITGIVTDASGARVPDASVSIANQQTGHSSTVTASGEGVYGIPALVPGKYRVTVTASGFSPVERDVSVEAGTTTTADLRLEVGAVTSSVTVPATVPMLHREDHQIGGVVRREQIENVPLNGRNFLELAKLEETKRSPKLGRLRRHASWLVTTLCD